LLPPFIVLLLFRDEELGWMDDGMDDGMDGWIERTTTTRQTKDII
jgi:hypothetical protein